MADVADHEDASPIVTFVFIDVTDIRRSRILLEDELGFRVAENRFNPPHHIHGIVKYDARNVILALNKARPAFDPLADDGATLVFQPVSRAANGNGHDAEPPQGCYRDADNHRFDIRPAGDAPHASVLAIRFDVADPGRTAAFFEEKVGWAMYRSAVSGEVTTRSGLPLAFVPAPGTATPTRQGVFLTVVHTGDIKASFSQLSVKGVPFLTEPQFSKIGGTVRFRDPDGHHFCLYEPSEISLGWESGPVLKRIVQSAASP